MKILVLLLALSAVRCQSGLCPSPTVTSVRFSIATRKNTTGHHIITADIINDYGGNGTSLDVEQAVISCGNTETVRLSATANYTHPRKTPSKPRSDYELYPGVGWYKMHTTSKAWYDAHDACIAEGAHLMVVNSQAESEVVKQLYSKNAPSYTSCSWIGFHDQFKEGRYVTVTGELVSQSGFNVWDSGEPSSSTSENCGCIYTRGKLWDGGCTSSVYFICEIEI